MEHQTLKNIAVTLICCVIAIAAAFVVRLAVSAQSDAAVTKIGFVYVGDLSDAYTSNFAEAQSAIEDELGERVETIAKYNVPEDAITSTLTELADSGCSLVFTTSYGYGDKTKKFAAARPDIQFCQATCSNANEEPRLSNYHTFMGRIYEGRYLSGVAAGMKLKEMLDAGEVCADQAKIGYIGAYELPEVISGYTAFFLGVRSVVSQATMTVKYTQSWSNYHLEKSVAKELIDEGCVVISQHSDTAGPAAACEETDKSQAICYVSYNESMADIAPTTYLTGAKINWAPYMTQAAEAVVYGKSIESCVKANVNGNDAGGGFDDDWIQMLKLNEFTAADGTQETVDKLTQLFRRGEVDVFTGDYRATDPANPQDTIDLSGGYKENETSSAPSFHYVLDDVITVED